jgi:hypothetical protein
MARHSFPHQPANVKKSKSQKTRKAPSTAQTAEDKSRTKGPHRKIGDRSADAPGAVHIEHTHPVDFGAVQVRLGQIKKMLAQPRPPDIVERCSDLPLVLDDESRKKAFHSAIAELEAALQIDGAKGAALDDFKLMMSGNFGRTIVDQYHRDDDTWSALHKSSYRHYERDRIIGLVYPWYNYSLYTDLLRVVRESNLDITAHHGITGKYRYFRFFPKDNRHFTLMDGDFDIEIDKNHNMLCFGQRSMNHRGTGYEHRGFVFPGVDKADFLTFRGGAMRLGTIHGDLKRRSNAILLTSTRGNKRPFAARVLIVKEGQDLYDLELPKVDGKREFQVGTPQYDRVLQELTNIVDGTVFPEAGFMWGNKPTTISGD